MSKSARRKHHKRQNHVTPAMIDAGVAVLLKRMGLFVNFFGPKELSAMVYRAMNQAKWKQRHG